MFKRFVNFAFIMFFLYTVINSEPVKLDIHMEAGCPYCRKFIKTSIKPLIATEGYEELIDLNFFPFGNGKEKLKVVIIIYLNANMGKQNAMEI